ncbi:NUMOD4 domain-containing protein [Methylobacterium sp. Gmos1]
MSEIWRPVVGYERFYEVSSLGRVRSMLNGRPRVLSAVVDNYGYPTIKLYRNSVAKRYKIHRLVCTAFNGPPAEDDMDCAHLDGSRNNSVPENLAWVSRAENMSHKRLHGTQQIGELGPSAKLSREQVEEIRRSYNAGEKRPSLAVKYGVTRWQIRRIVLGKAWR